jgi:hypothetical protein
MYRQARDRPSKDTRSGGRTVLIGSLIVDTSTEGYSSQRSAAEIVGITYRHSTTGSHRSRAAIAARRRGNGSRRLYPTATCSTEAIKTCSTPDTPGARAEGLRVLQDTLDEDVARSPGLSGDSVLVSEAQTRSSTCCARDRACSTSCRWPASRGPRCHDHRLVSAPDPPTLTPPGVGDYASAVGE